MRGRHSDHVIGEAVMDIFRAFYQERKRLAEANICPCRACRHINQLDVKIFVHRGQAARFEFRGTVDHFGTDVIVLHRIMKNGVGGHRYVMVTEAAATCISLPGAHDQFSVQEHVEHIGNVRASVFRIRRCNRGRSVSFSIETAAFHARRDFAKTSTESAGHQRRPVQPVAAVYMAPHPIPIRSSAFSFCSLLNTA